MDKRNPIVGNAVGALMLSHWLDAKEKQNRVHMKMCQKNPACGILFLHGQREKRLLRNHPRLSKVEQASHD